MTSEEIKRSEKAGLSPGTLMYVGEEKSGKPRITVMDYDATGFLEKEVGSVEECFPFKETSTVTWINVDGVHDASVIEKLGAYFDIHPLVLEDIMTTTQRPKTEDLGTALFVVLRMIEYSEQGVETTADQLSLILGPNYVLTFQETQGDCLDPVRDRIRSGKGRIRKQGPDYLAYAVIDSVVDNYFFVLEKLGERIDTLEEQLIAEPRRELLGEIHGLKREMIELRKSVWPLREVVSGLERSESPLIKE
jgi:magnesium transporter